MRWQTYETLELEKRGLSLKEGRCVNKVLPCDLPLLFPIFPFSSLRLSSSLPKHPFVPLWDSRSRANGKEPALGQQWACSEPLTAPCRWGWLQGWELKTDRGVCPLLRAAAQLLVAQQQVGEKQLCFPFAFYNLKTDTLLSVSLLNTMGSSKGFCL